MFSWESFPELCENTHITNCCVAQNTHFCLSHVVVTAALPQRRSQGRNRIHSLLFLKLPQLFHLPVSTRPRALRTGWSHLHLLCPLIRDVVNFFICDACICPFLFSNLASYTFPPTLLEWYESLMELSSTEQQIFALLPGKSSKTTFQIMSFLFSEFPQLVFVHVSAFKAVSRHPFLIYLATFLYCYPVCFIFLWVHFTVLSLKHCFYTPLHNFLLFRYKFLLRNFELSKHLNSVIKYLIIG